MVHPDNFPPDFEFFALPCLICPKLTAKSKRVNLLSGLKIYEAIPIMRIK